MIVLLASFALLGRSLLWRRHEIRSPRTFVLAGFVVVLGLGLVAASGRVPFESEGTLRQVETMAMVGLLAFELGAVVGRRWPRLAPFRRPARNVCHMQRLLAGSLAMMSIGAYYLRLKAESYGLGLVPFILANRSLPWRIEAIPGERYLWWVENLPMGAGALGFTVALLATRPPHRLLGLLAAACGFFFSFNGGSRFSVMQYVAAISLLYGTVGRTGVRPGRRRLVAVAFSIAACYLLLEVMSQTRFKGRGLLDARVENARGSVTLAQVDMVGSTMMAYYFFPRYHAYLWGSSYWGILVNPIPRAWWPGKPKALGVIMSELRGNVAYSEAVSIVGELHANFGPAGVPAGLFILGWGCELLYAQYLRRRQDLRFVVLYLFSLGFAAMMVRGEFQTVWVHFLSVAVWMYVVLSWSMTPGRAPSRAVSGVRARGGRAALPPPRPTLGAEGAAGALRAGAPAP